MISISESLLLLIEQDVVPQLGDLDYLDLDVEHHPHIRNSLIRMARMKNQIHTLDDEFEIMKKEVIRSAPHHRMAIPSEGIRFYRQQKGEKISWVLKHKKKRQDL